MGAISRPLTPRGGELGAILPTTYAFRWGNGCQFGIYLRLEAVKWEPIPDRILLQSAK